MHKQYLTTKGGNPAKDQYVVHEDDGTEKLYSYGTLIGIRHTDGSLELTEYWDYSQTTNYYRGKWSGYGKPETRKLIEQGKIKLI